MKGWDCRQGVWNLISASSAGTCGAAEAQLSWFTLFAQRGPVPPKGRNEQRKRNEKGNGLEGMSTAPNLMRYVRREQRMNRHAKDEEQGSSFQNHAPGHKSPRKCSKMRV